MVIVDTSVWIHHLRDGDRHLCSLLEAGDVVCHPFIVGELACGNLKNRREILALFQSLPSAPTVDHDEILFFIDSNKLMGTGIGLIDVHLLASARLSRISLWTSDTKLRTAAGRLKLSYR